MSTLKDYDMQKRIIKLHKQSVHILLLVYWFDSSKYLYKIIYLKFVNEIYRF